MRKISKVYLLAIVLLVALLPIPVATKTKSPYPAPQDQTLSVVPEEIPFVTEVAGSGLNCRRATREETQALLRQDTVQRHVITPAKKTQTGGLTIILRATPQLDSFPAAKAAFLAAAARWESLISTPITIVIDVDFGPSFFGFPFPPGVIGATFAQELAASGIYPFVRNNLIAGASNSRELLLYGQLPLNSVPTDIGQTTFVLSSSADFRALGLISPVADPIGELPFFGPPPKIGFNSGFPLISTRMMALTRIKLISMVWPRMR